MTARTCLALLWNAHRAELLIVAALIPSLHIAKAIGLLEFA